MEPVFMVLGQSSAMAAVMAIDNNAEIQNVDVSQLQHKLKTDPLADGRSFDILVDNNDTSLISVSGNWTTESKGGYGPSFLTASGNNETVLFTATINAKGKYNCYLYVPKISDMSSRTQVTVFDGKKSKEVTIRSADVIVEGQTSGEWVSLGSYTLSPEQRPTVTVSTKNADGKVIADAVIWTPANN
jgi:hypothetical protein